MNEAQEEFAIANVGGDQPTQRDMPRALSRMLVPGDQIRKGAPKMQLRDWEEAALELVCRWKSLQRPGAPVRILKGDTTLSQAFPNSTTEARIRFKLVMQTSSCR